MFWAFIILTHPSVLQELNFIIYTRGGGSWYFRPRSREGLANFTPIAGTGHLISEPKFKIPTSPLPLLISDKSLKEKKLFEETFPLKCVWSRAQQAARKGGNFGAKLTHLCGFWLDVSFFSHVKKNRSRFWLDVSIFSRVKTIVHSSDWLELICVSKFTHNFLVSISPLPCAQRSLCRWKSVRKGTWEGDNCTLPIAVHHQSLLYFAKNEAPEEKADFSVCI